MKLSALIGLLFAVLLVGGPPALASDDRAGIGSSKAWPAGRTFEWPEGLAVPEVFHGYHNNDCRRREKRKPDAERGVGNYVQICLGMINTTGAPIRLELPAGLLFVSVEDDTQNGLLINVETFEIPPSDEPYFVRLNLWCANADRSPGGLGDDFNIGPVTEDAGIVALIQTLAGRTITRDDWAAVQDLVWQVTDGKELTPRARAFLNRAEP